MNASFRQALLRRRSRRGPPHSAWARDPGTPTNIEIIGVVNDTRYESLRDEIPLQVYLCASQSQANGRRPSTCGRSAIRIAAFGAVRAAVHELDPNLPVSA